MRQNEKGLTLIELIIVLAVIAIIGGMIAPNFVGTTEKARLRSDIQSAVIIQSALNLYEAENGKAVDGIKVEDKIENLVSEGYLKEGKWDTQTSGVVWEMDGNVVKVVIGASESLQKIAGQLTEQEQAQIKGVIVSPK